MDNGSKDGLAILRMPQGGFLVSDVYTDRGMFCQQHFACTTIDEALKFIRDAVNPIPAQQGQVGVD